jgi:hypothetical protein
MSDFNGLDVHLGNVARLSSATSWSISAENPDGAKGNGARATEGTMTRQARDLGPGWKMSPCITLPPGPTRVRRHPQNSEDVLSILRMDIQSVRRRCLT